MITMLKKLFGATPAPDFRDLMTRGAVIVDVRTRDEYRQGHLKGSLNIPLNTLSSEYKKLRADRPVITCCASGIRSAQARVILQSKGFTEVYNGGGWVSLRNKIG